MSDVKPNIYGFVICGRINSKSTKRNYAIIVQHLLNSQSISTHKKHKCYGVDIYMNQIQIGQIGFRDLDSFYDETL